MKRLLEGARLLDPLHGIDRVGSVLVEDGRILALDPGTVEAEHVDLSGRVLAPGFVDLAANLRDPGRDWLEGLQNGAAAAAAGGFTTVVLSPDVDPVTDEPTRVAALVERAASAPVELAVAGAVTVGLGGRDLAEVGLMAEAGAVAYSDGAHALDDVLVLRHALLYLRPLGLPVLLRAGEPTLEAAGAMHDGEIATRIGLRGIPAGAEELAIARIAALAHDAGCSVHLTGVTTARGVAMVRHQQAIGAPVTASTIALHTLLTDAAVRDSIYDSATRVVPPLRTESDRLSVVEALSDGTLVAATSWHEPLCRVEKELEFELCEPGATGLETALSSLVEGTGDLATAIRALTGGATVLGREHGLVEGAPADLVVLQPDARWTVGELVTRGTNTPLRGRELPVVVEATLKAGVVVHGAL